MQGRYLVADKETDYIMPPIPPIPPMPPMPPPAGIAGSSFGISVMTACKYFCLVYKYYEWKWRPTSAVQRRDATPAASVRAVLTTLAGSMIPVAIMSTIFSLAASKPSLTLAHCLTLLTTTEASRPALSAIVYRGLVSAYLTISTPFFWSSFSGVTASTAGRHLAKD